MSARFADDNRVLVDEFIGELIDAWSEADPSETHLAEKYGQQLRLPIMALVHGYARAMRADCAHDLQMIEDLRDAKKTGASKPPVVCFDATEAVL
ncbi:hypothetical protein OS128_05275 [Corynebacterium sp. P5848]|uniref:hypothetical protein n=1 Tax=Corynebacterium marambiense TaxID=2765364 RepID=UPI002260F7F9|nr:hypothetical protein [Corynebacterium marambiense]MCX7542322.1 hypothetical protein [Corynebacterium marambiense]